MWRNVHNNACQLIDTSTVDTSDLLMAIDAGKNAKHSPKNFFHEPRVPPYQENMI